ncbi:MAG: hypothetical protein V9G18_22170 [Albidovulum sp.]
MYYLSGEIQTVKIDPVASIDRHRLAACSGQTMTIRRARAQELGPWLDWVAIKGEVFVRFWLGPGEQAVVFEVGGAPPEEPIPEGLKRFL